MFTCPKIMTMTMASTLTLTRIPTHMDIAILTDTATRMGIRTTMAITTTTTTVATLLKSNSSFNKASFPIG
jgi:hypothetical protein